MSSEEHEGTIPTKTQQLRDFADTITETSLERLSLEGQLKQALISLETYIDSDKTIPKYALSKAKGIVFLSLIKCGFLVEGCIGIGCIIVKYHDLKNKWSGPSSIICGGLSVGLLAGATKIDYIIILPNKDAVKSFMSSGQFRLGTDLSLSVGTLGRNINANIGIGDIGPISVIYSYSHSKGLYGGISLHGKILKVLHKYNQSFYGMKVSNEAILSGDIQMPIDYKSDDYNKIIFILKSYCFEPSDENDANMFMNKYEIKSIDHNIDEHKSKQNENDKCVKDIVKECECKLCQRNNILAVRKKKLKLNETNPFNNEIHFDVSVQKTPQKQNKGRINKVRVNKVRIRNKNMTVNQLQIKPKIQQQTAKTIILKETFLEPTPPPIIIDDGKYKYNDAKMEIHGDDVKIKEVYDPWKDKQEIKQENKNDTIQNAEGDNKIINIDPYALSVRPWDAVVEQNVNKQTVKKQDDKFKKVLKNVKQKQSKEKVTFTVDVDEKDEKQLENKTKFKQTELQNDDEKGINNLGTKHKKYVKPDRCDIHYSDYEISSYTLDKYDENGYRINSFKLLFQIDDISYQTEIQIAGKLVSKQYIVNWPKKRDCKAVIIVTSKVYSSYIDPYSNENDNYELRLICYDERDDDLIVYNININFTNISQLVNAINGAFIISPNKPWIVLESIFSQYKQKMYESMIDISKNYNDQNVLKYGDLIRANFGSLCQYGIYVGEGEIVCFRRRFPNNGSSAFKKYRLFLIIFNGKASKKIRMKYMTLKEFIFDCSRIEVIYYPLPSISPIVIVKKALIATNNGIKNCIFECSPIIESQRTLTTKEIIEDSVLSVIDGIASTVNTISEVVSPVTK